MNAAIDAVTLETTPFQYPELASFCKAAGDQLRLEILKVLADNAYGVLELCQLFDAKQSGMSHHLKVLASEGLVSTRREGNSIFYRRAIGSDNPSLAPLHKALLATLDNLELRPELTARTASLQQERSRQSRAFFEQNTERFKANQDLIAGYEQYGASVVEFLDSIIIAGDTSAALEVGPGEGELLPELAQRFGQVTALDNSGQVLALAQQAAQQQKLEGVKFILGDILQPNPDIAPVNCITLNMVLHHIPTPALAFYNMSQLLLPDGSLLVTDLCRHDQNWARENCGDIWLGFEPGDLTTWAKAAGLGEGASLFLALRNGFQIQLRQFIKAC